MAEATSAVVDLSTLFSSTEATSSVDDIGASFIPGVAASSVEDILTDYTPFIIQSFTRTDVVEFNVPNATPSNPAILKSRIYYDSTRNRIRNAYASAGYQDILCWTKYTKSYSDFSYAGLSNTISLFTLPAAAVIRAIKIKHSASFTGPSISSYTISVGIAADVTKYASPFNVYQAVADTAFQLSSCLGLEDNASGTTITATATSVGANLSVATAGSVSIYVLTSDTSF